jgi:hypothetical protein
MTAFYRTTSTSTSTKMAPSRSRVLSSATSLLRKSEDLGVDCCRWVDVVANVIETLEAADEIAA